MIKIMRKSQPRSYAAVPTSDGYSRPPNSSRVKFHSLDFFLTIVYTKSKTAKMGGKKKAKKAPIEIKPEYVIGQNVVEPPKKKKKKNAPDRPQPTWLFPPDEHNPVLNPHPKSEAQREKDEKAKDQAIKFLRYKSVEAPVKDPPPDLLLTLVGAFLTSYGFNSTSRLYSSQLQSRKKLDEWKTQLDVKLPKGFPDLVRIFNQWHKMYQETTAMDESSSSSDSDDSSDTKEKKKTKKTAKNKATAETLVKNETSSSGGSDSSSEEDDSDVEMKDASTRQKTSAKRSNRSKAKPSSASTSASSTDSDTDDEGSPYGDQTPQEAQEILRNRIAGLAEMVKQTGRPTASFNGSGVDSDSAPKSKSTKKSPPPSENKSKTTKKPSVPSSSSDASSSDNESGAKVPEAAATVEKVMPSKVADSLSSDDSSSDSEPKKNIPQKDAPTKVQKKTSSSSDETSSSSDDSDEVDFSIPPKPTKKASSSPPKPALKTTHVPSDSSETLQATSAQKPSTAETSLSSTSSSDSAPPPSSKRKRSPSPAETKSEKQVKKQNTPFQRVPQDTPVDPKMSSNAYRSYDYAERAHQDLSVTKGKGFTKEKNKKKRGSYKGGAIDVSGGKGIKFED